MNTMTVEKKNYCTQNQKQTLINLMKEKENEPLLSGKFSPSFTFQHAKSKWQNIASVLNSTPGASKDWKQWKKTWQDLRSKTKRKKSEQLKYTRGTGGGPPHPDELDDEDELILSTIPSTAITGDINIKETPIEFEFPSDGIIIDQPVDTQSPAVIVPDEIAEIVVDEHLYAKENVVPMSTTPKTKRTMASQRLHTSALAASTLAEVSQSTLEVQKQYYAQKLQLLERQVVALEKLVEVVSRRDIH